MYLIVTHDKVNKVLFLQLMYGPDIFEEDKHMGRSLPRQKKGRKVQYLGRKKSNRFGENWKRLNVMK